MAVKNKIVINYGKNISDITYESLERYNAAGLIGNKQKVLIKPNLVNSTAASNGATTHPEVVDGIIRYLRDNGHHHIEIIESSWVGGNTDEAFRVCGYNELSKKYNVECINVLKHKFRKVSYDGISMDVSEKVFEGAFLIDVPVLKAHCQTTITCCIKNLKGLITANEKRNFHTLGLHKPIAALSAIVKVGLNVVDGICGDLTFEEGGNPVETNMILVGEDPVLVDSYAAEYMGCKPSAIKYLTLSRDYKAGEFYSESTELITLNSDKKPMLASKLSRIADGLGKYVDERDACSACYSALIHALYRADKKEIERFTDNKVVIGQGFRGAVGDGVGFGSCTSGFKKCVKGCPPKAIDFFDVLYSQVNSYGKDG